MRATSIVRARSPRRSGTLSFTTALALAALAGVSAGASGAAGHPRPAHRPRPGARTRVLVDRMPLTSPSGGTVVVHGTLRPGLRGATVQLMTRAGHGWQTLAVARTRRNGRFRIPYRVAGAGATPVRVRFTGSRRHRPAWAAAGQIVALVPTVASWYFDGGQTACGFHATYGVANRTLPCGTRVTLAYGGRTVRATVDDRGPYVGGRSFDLNQNTARFLGMWGVATVFASV